MVYSEYLRQPDIQQAFEAAGVASIPSSLDDFIVPPDLDKQTIIDHEILYRKKLIELKKKEAKKEADAYFEPYRKKEPKISAVRPYVEKLIQGKLAGAYASIENAVISHISERIADKHDFRTIEEQPKEDLSGFTDLERTMKKYHVTYFDKKKTKPEDIVLKFIIDSGFAKMIK